MHHTTRATWRKERGLDYLLKRPWMDQQTNSRHSILSMSVFGITIQSSFLGNLEVIELNSRKVNNINPHVMIQTYAGTESLVAIVIRNSGV